MKNLKDTLDAMVEPIQLGSGSSFSNFLTEESDFEERQVITEDDDPFASAGGDAAGDNGGNDAGAGDAGGADPFGSSSDPFGGDTAGGDAGGDSGTGDNSASEGSEDGGDDNADDTQDGNPALTDGSHEDDPEFNQGQPDEDDVTLSKSPAIHSTFNVTDIMKTVMTVIQTLSEDQLVEIEKVKNDIELIFNGKLLNEEDLEFDNIENAIFLIEKIADKLDMKVSSYLIRKFKEPLIKKRDTIKQDIAVKKGELNTTRDILTKLDTKV